MAGLIFGLVYLFAPGRGLLAQIRRRINQRWEFAQAMLSIHLYQHENLPEADFESSYDHLGKHMRWTDDFAGTVVAKAQRRDLINREGDLLHLTEQGRKLARETLVR
jgi:manganese/zinc/iron transport system permease protein